MSTPASKAARFLQVLRPSTVLKMEAEMENRKPVALFMAFGTKAMFTQFLTIEKRPFGLVPDKKDDFRISINAVKVLSIAIALAYALSANVLSGATAYAINEIRNSLDFGG
ncbi:hypothetical protein GH714_004514 [Hevea brasiliensis]|uniref:Uncharacterized protein n=1 Tax=Hevea brasiliensis TaxID=3981 RepID=A0A6A6L247_HEVBR|nr:hypothetical protein GH714_004514 [Hevea brasiliensis]